jgi:serine protease Do
LLQYLLRPWKTWEREMNKERLHAVALLAALAFCAATSLKISGAFPHGRRDQARPTVPYNLSLTMLARGDSVQIYPAQGDSSTIAEEHLLGAGFAARRDGVIVTARRVVGDAPRVLVHLKSGAECAGRVISDPSNPLALVRIGAVSLVPFGFEARPLPKGFSAMRPPSGSGSREMAIVQCEPGPSGRIAYTSRDQCAAGEPLVDLMGRVVAVDLDTTGPARVGEQRRTALCADAASEDVQRLLAMSNAMPAEQITSPEARSLPGVKLGIQVTEANPRTLDSYCLPKDGKGAIVAAVFPDSPAMRGHIRVGDLLVAVGGKKIERAEEVADAVRLLEPGRDAGIMVERIGGRLLLPVTAGRPEQPDLSQQRRAAEAMN